MPTITKIPGRDDLPKGLGHMAILHGITPETETSTHYFGFSTRNFRQGDATLDRFQFDSEMEVRRQDVDAIEDMEKRIDQAAKFQKELIVVADKAAIQARRKVDAMLAAENKPTENK
jgi:vanillate O-demethylase monooxygenase subunit